MIQTNEGLFPAVAIYDERPHFDGNETVLVRSLESDHVFRCYKGVADNKFQYGENPTFYAC